MPRKNLVITPIPGRPGKWTEELIDYTPEEEARADQENQAEIDAAPARAMADMRYKRDGLLAETDWWGASDKTMTDAQTAYRTALRDYPATFTADNSAAWPTKP